MFISKPLLLPRSIIITSPFITSPALLYQCPAIIIVAHAIAIMSSTAIATSINVKIILTIPGKTARDVASKRSVERCFAKVV
jgi:hypothetical protein